MLRATILFFLTLALHSSFAFAGSIDIAHKPFPEQCRVLDSIRKAANRNKKLNYVDELASLLNYAIDKEDDELEMLINITLLGPSLKKKSISESQFITEMHYLIDKCIKYKWHHLAATAYHEISKHWYANGSYVKSIKYAIKSYELFANFEASYYIYKKRDIIDLATSYGRFKDYKNANVYLHIARTINGRYELRLLNNIALNHMLLGNKDSALYYFDALYQESLVKGNIVYQVLAKANAISIYVVEKKYDTAMAMSKNIYPIIEKELGPTHIADALDRIGYIYLLQGKYKDAEIYNRLSRAKYQSTSKYWYYEQLPTAYLIFEHTAKTYAGLRNYKLAYTYRDSATLVKDSLNTKTNLKKLKDIEKELAKSKLDFANQKLLYQQTQVKQQRNLLVLSIIAATFIVLFIVNRFKNRRKILEQEKRYANTRLKESQDKLSAFTKSIQDKNKLLESFEQKLNRYEPDENTTEQNNSIKELRGATILTDEEWEDFRDNFEIVHIGFLSRLKDQYTKLTPAEIRYIVLSKLNMSTKEMASILGVSTNSIRTLKSRVIKKMDLNQEQNLQDIIDAI